MGNPVYLPFSAAGTTTPVTLDWTITPPNTSFAVDLAGSSTGTFTVQFTLQDISNGTANAVWHNDATINNTTSALVGNIIFPARALQLLVSNLSSGGTGTFSVLQGFPP